MLKRPVGELTVIDDLMGNPRGRVQAIDEEGSLFIKDTTCFCCEELIWLPFMANHRLGGNTIQIQHNSIWDGDRVCKKVCSVCDSRIILKIHEIKETTLVE